MVVFKISKEVMRRLYYLKYLICYIIHGLKSSLIVSFELYISKLLHFILSSLVYLFYSFHTFCMGSLWIAILACLPNSTLRLSDCDGLVDEDTILKVSIIPVSSFLVQSGTDCSALFLCFSRMALFVSVICDCHHFVVDDRYCINMVSRLYKQCVSYT